MKDSTGRKPDSVDICRWHLNNKYHKDVPFSVCIVCVINVQGNLSNFNKTLTWGMSSNWPFLTQGHLSQKRSDFPRLRSLRKTEYQISAAL